MQSPFPGTSRRCSPPAPGPVTPRSPPGPARPRPQTRPRPTPPQSRPRPAPALPPLWAWRVVAVGVSSLAPPLGRYLPSLPCPPPPAGRALPLTGAMAEQPEEGAPAPPAPAPPAPPAALPLSAPPGGSQRLLFSHDLVSGRYRGSVRFGLVRLIHGEDSEEDSEEGGRGAAAGGAASSGGSESGGPGAGGEEGRASPLRRGYVRVQWYPEGIKQHVKETKVTGAGGGPRPARARVPPRGAGAGCTTGAPPWRPPGAGPARPAGLRGRCVGGSRGGGCCPVSPVTPARAASSGEGDGALRSVKSPSLPSSRSLRQPSMDAAAALR